MANIRHKRLEGFSERLRQAIYDSGMTCIEISRRIERERKSIYGYMRGDVQPDAYTMARLCTVLNVSADYLLFGKAYDA